MWMMEDDRYLAQTTHKSSTPEALWRQNWLVSLKGSWWTLAWTCFYGLNKWIRQESKQVWDVWWFRSSSCLLLCLNNNRGSSGTVDSVTHHVRHCVWSHGSLTCRSCFLAHSLTLNNTWTHFWPKWHVLLHSTPTATLHQGSHITVTLSFSGALIFDPRV